MLSHELAANFENFSLGVTNYVFTFTCSNLSDIHQSRLAGFAPGLRMAYDAGCLWSSLLVCRVHIDGDILYDDHIGSDQSADDQEIPYKVDRYRIHSADGHGAFRLFVFKILCNAIPVCCAIWSGSRSNRCIGESLCGEQLFRFGYEFPSLFLWSRCSDQPGHNGIGLK